MTTDEKLDHIIKLLERLCHVVDPMPGYVQRNDGLWYNKTTGESHYDEQQRSARLNTIPRGV
jgi:hypothetical protein